MVHVLTPGWAVLFFAAVAMADDRLPRSLDPGIKIELFAEQPQIVTPTGIDVDAQGRVWAIESNTHFPPENYAGHKTDRLLVMQDLDGDGRAEKVEVFADGFTHAMSVAVRKHAEPGKPDQVYVATRREIAILSDTDGDLRADVRTPIIRLETAGNYPHNGLAGFAWDSHGWMYFGFGENLGAKYRVVGTDSVSHSGGAEGGNLYRCRPDGTKLELWATGFWNPHASCIDTAGRMFTVDNDPDSRPPCRLLHIIRGGDYGYRFRNGRKGMHPFTSWNGEIPGTLPMVAGTGEAPSGIVAYNGAGLPSEYHGDLLVTSWGDHRIDRFRLKPRGASYESVAEPLIVGDENFRPVGLAIAPDGSLYCTDWVLKDYKLHGRGRLWRISGRSPRVQQPRAPSPVSNQVSQSRELFNAVQESSWKEPASFDMPERQLAIQALAIHDPFLFAAATRLLARMPFEERTLTTPLRPKDSPVPVTDSDLARMRAALVLAARWQQPRSKELAATGLASPDPVVRKLTVQWIAEERLTDLRPRVQLLLDEEPMTADLFLAVLAALEMLDGVDPANFDKTPAGKYVLPILMDDRRSVAVRTQALRLVPPTDAAITAELIRKLLQFDDRALKLETVRTLQASRLSDAPQLLRDIAADESADLQLRAEALVGLAPAIARSKPGDADYQLATQLLKQSEPPLTIETLRALRTYDRKDSVIDDLLKLATRSQPVDTPVQQEIADELARLLPAKASPVHVQHASESRPASIGQWLNAADSGGDAQAGRRVFFHPLGAGCWKCHTVDGRGGAIGPDLSMIGRTMNRQRLAQSILEPSKEVAPQFTSWTFLMTNGQAHQGMLLGDTRDGRQRIGLADGREMELNVSEIEESGPGALSIMPANLIDQLSVFEFRHLLAFLEALK